MTTAAHGLSDVAAVLAAAARGIAILHRGRIIANDTLEQLTKLLPPAEVSYVEKQPTLEEIFFALVGDRNGEAA